ncbi:MAG: xanthine dehydrogenase molybdopterin binding subunit [Opitutales bacterium]
MSLETTEQTRVIPGEFRFWVNGQEHLVRDRSPQTTLLEYLREKGLTGTKQGCSEGDCGACTVAVIERDAHGQPTYRAVNSCIGLLPMYAGKQVITVEGLAEKDQALHPVQQSMVHHYGSQCGFCTPGFIVSMLEGYYRGDLKTRPQLADQLCGNLCRCTGYRPIRDAAAEAIWQHRVELESDQTPPGRLLREAARKEGDAGDETGGNLIHGEEFFFHPRSLQEVFELWHRYPKARLIAGATEIGVEVAKFNRKSPQLISLANVPELRAVTRTTDHWSLGGAATMVEIEEAMDGDIPSLDKLWRVFASRQIRNNATLGGNLATASPIGDSAPLLLALGASVELASAQGERVVALESFFTGYRKTLMEPGELIRAVRIPHHEAPAGQAPRVDFLKVSKRREMDISAVAGGFYLETDAKGRVREIRLGYGGVAATPVRAVQTEAVLRGNALDAPTRQRALKTLAGEFLPISDGRASAEYRAGIVVSLFEKFLDGVQSEAQDADLDYREDLRWDEDDISRNLAHESGHGHVSGRARYVDDMGAERPMLELWPVLSGQAHARILSKDDAAALAVPGVIDVLWADAIPGFNDVGPSRPDEPLLADDEVFYEGQLVAVVVGETLQACRDGAQKIDITYEPLPAILSVREAIEQDSFHYPANYMTRGDVQVALADSPHTLEGTFDFGGQEHFYLETQAAWAFVDTEGDVFVSSSTQHPSEIQHMVAQVLGVPKNRVVAQSPRMGGGFGGKETQGNHWAALAAVVSQRHGRAARIMLDRDIDIRTTGKRHGFHARFRVGFDDDGTLLALEADLFSDGGWSLDLSMPVTDRAMFHIDNAYYIPALKVSGRATKANLPSNTAFRGFGGPQGMLIIEEIMDRVARRVGVAPEALRERNFYHGDGETSTTHYGQRIEHNRLQRIWPKLLKSSAFSHRRAEVDAFNATSPRIKRGLAVTPVKFGISFTLTHYNQAGALVHIYQDGTVQVNHGGTEMGQGLHTKILGIAMRELGLPAQAIRMMKTATDKVPNTSATAASSGSDLNGAAVRNACQTLIERLRPIAADILAEAGVETDPGHIVFRDGTFFDPGKPDVAPTFLSLAKAAHKRRVSLSTTGFYATPGIHWDRAKGLGKPFHYYAFGAAVSEVEVDGYSGMNRLRRVDILHDVGDSLNPGVDRGQIEGGFVQGMGWLTREELKWDAAGKLLTHSASTYQIPAFSDAPAVFNVELLPDALNEDTIHGSKAVGEPPLMLAISVREALRDAVAAFVPKDDTREVPLGCPATNEAIFHAIRARESLIS